MFFGISLKESEWIFLCCIGYINYILLYPYKIRYIAGSSKCSTKPISKLLTPMCCVHRVSLCHFVFVCWHTYFDRDEDYNTLLTVVSQILTFSTKYVCLFCSHIYVNITKLYETVIQVRG